MKIIFLDIDGVLNSDEYFDKIRKLDIHLASRGSKCLQQHYVFYKTDFDKTYGVSKELKTYIYIDKYNKNQYISLSKLCN